MSDPKKVTSAAMSKFAQAQLASEALVQVFASEANGQSKHDIRGVDLIAALMDGNRRVSRFTKAAAEEFASQWQLVEQMASTSTGFSGTLFKYIGPDDPANGLKSFVLLCIFHEYAAH